MVNALPLLGQKARERTRYSERGKKARFVLDSSLEFVETCYSDCILFRSLLHGFEAIYWVIFSTQRHKKFLSCSEVR